LFKNHELHLYYGDVFTGLLLEGNEEEMSFLNKGKLSAGPKGWVIN
jgi:hypothetical protein